MLHSNSWFAVVVIILPGLLISCPESKHSDTDWRVYRGNEQSTGYSTLEQVNMSTVKNLNVAWTYYTGDAREGNRSTIQCNPIIVNGMMYVTSPQLKLIALNPATGEEMWQFNPFADSDATGVNRGVTYWEDGQKKRILFSAGSFLYSLDADNGNLDNEFGDGGKIDLREGLGRDPEKLAVWASSPGIIYKNILIQGTGLNEGYDAAPGFVRGYDVNTGKILWTFHTIPQPDEFGYETWESEAYKTAGGVNSWAGMSIDSERGMVFIPTGSAAFDFYGGNRKGENLFANCLIALDAATGKRIWHYQLVHHDLWDYDLPAPPVLVTIESDNGKVDAVAQTTKMGMLFLFERETGKPIFPITERPVPQSDLIGEETSPTQPFPEKPLPFVRHSFSEEEITNISPEANAFVKEKLAGRRMSSIYTPPSVEGSVQFPGTRGGGEWGGASFDPETNILYVNANEVPMLFSMKAIQSSETETILQRGERMYALNNCSSCHGAKREGVGAIPSLQQVSTRLTRDNIFAIVRKGRGQMPSFPNLSEDELSALVAYLMNDDKTITPSEDKKTVSSSVRYVHEGWNVLTDQDGYPGVKPPWGTLNAIDLNTGVLLWKIPLGEFAELTEKGIPQTGTPNLGGPVVTAGGLIFIGATKDEKFRAFDKSTGELVWEYKLPAGGYATPSTYMVNGKQYIVIAAGGGGKVGSPSGDAYVAFCLP